MSGQQINSAREHATLSINDQIATWLDGLGLAQYATVFAENAIDLDILPDVTEADLEKLGVALGHRKRILRAIAALSKGGAPADDAEESQPNDADPGVAVV